MIEGLNETPRHWLPILGLHPETWSYQGHVQAQTAAQRFATVSGLNDMFPENGVQRGLRYVFSCLVGVVKKCQPNQQRHVYKPRGIKETARTMGPSEVVYKYVRCSSVYAEDMFVVRVL